MKPTQPCHHSTVMAHFFSFIAQVMEANTVFQFYKFSEYAFSFKLVIGFVSPSRFFLDCRNFFFCFLVLIVTTLTTLHK